MNIDYTATFGEKLHEWRIANNLSQNAVAQKLNCARKTISDWEKNLILPNYDSIIAVTVLMDVSADWLLGIADVRKNQKTSPEE